MKVLVTCGPTWVPIDQVRVISNTSTGHMGHAIADAFIKAGAKVTVVEGPVTDSWHNRRAKVFKYCFFDELARLLRTLLRQRFDVVVHAAAVSDFRLAKPSATKIDSSKPVSLNLTPTIKLIELIRRIAPKTILVGFKLEATLAKAVKDGKALLAKAGCDLLVANSSGKVYKACLLDKHGRSMVETSSKEKIAQCLAQAIVNHIKLSGK